MRASASILRVNWRGRDELVNDWIADMSDGDQRVAALPVPVIEWVARRDAQAEAALACFLGEKARRIRVEAALAAEKLRTQELGAEVLSVTIERDELRRQARWKVSPELAVGGVIVGALVGFGFGLGVGL